MDKIKVLLVEDEAVLALLVKESLATRGFDVQVAANGVEGWSMFNLHKPDICVVDIMMPRKDGFSLVADIRMIDDLIPIIFLTAKTQTVDVLKGLEMGADDYMKKPFSMEELILRVKGLLKRNNAKPEPDSGLVPDQFLGRLRFNHLRMQLYNNGQTIELSKREADLMQLLLQYKNQLLDRRIALLKLWGNDDVFNARSMDVYITRLRKFIRNDDALEILNVRGHGYTLIERIN
jgi:two-component system response regulator TrcR